MTGLGVSIVTEGQYRARILAAGRKLLGTKYDELDCSHFVHKAYDEAGLSFPYANTASYAAMLVGKYFIEVGEANPGDLVLYPHHVGLYDPNGCSIVHSAECQRAEKEKLGEMRILSARSGKNMGVEYGQASWFGTGKFLAWKGFQKTTS